MSTPRPVAVRVFAGNTGDARSFLTAISAVRDRFGLQNMTMVGDRGMITNARVADLASPPGMDWITALRAPAIAALARDDGPPQRSPFDTQNFAEITHHDLPGERPVCRRNPAPADERARKRDALLPATEQNLARSQRRSPQVACAEPTRSASQQERSSTKTRSASISSPPSPTTPSRITGMRAR
jgi:hypothetical protein